ncbi:hypothetical protein K491DRAFT_735734 [Lophiostoma macrostomum CBS 122681]|uniref:Lysine-specific metallo-endopeptidase domain-containing protein n=1 Tax=Lophiostoma macrostomum CBS 122681 TaxID=1314788 RepID=A0A6A6SMZ5_9PLEO|nr:hypothetical protein K491DRAFT_735734 [Lophiostoma macrostomum CBS 122681]
MRLETTKVITFTFGFLECVIAAPSSGLAERADITKRLAPSFGQWNTNIDNLKHKAQAAFYDAIILARTVHTKPNTEKWDKIFPKYFQLSEKVGVEKIFATISGAKKKMPNNPYNGLDDGVYDGSDLFKKVTVVNSPVLPERECEAPNYEDRMLAWLQNMDEDRAVIRFCPRGLKYPTQDETKCSDLDNEVSGKMSTIGGIMLHEMTHFAVIGKANIGVDIIHYDDPGYGPLNTRTFNSPNRVPYSNADQFRWFAQEYYWTITCNKDFADPVKNDDYLKCKDGGSNCVAM